jgi:hypothetical protein
VWSAEAKTKLGCWKQLRRPRQASPPIWQSFSLWEPFTRSAAPEWRFASWLVRATERHWCLCSKTSCLSDTLIIYRTTSSHGLSLDPSQSRLWSSLLTFLSTEVVRMNTQPPNSSHLIDRSCPFSLLYPMSFGCTQGTKNSRS